MHICIKNVSAVNIELRMKFLLQLALKVCNFLTNNEDCCEGQHIADISNAAAVKNRVYVWQGVVALCENFANVSLALVNLQSRAEDINCVDFAWLFFNQFCAQKMSDSRENEEF